MISRAATVATLPATETPSAIRARTRHRRFLGRLGGYVFVLPYLTLFVVFLIFPLFYGLWLSGMRYELVSPQPPRFIGAGNYLEALRDPAFWNALGATVLFVVAVVPVTLVLALALAAGLEAVISSRRQSFYRLCIFLPTMITISVGGLVWRWFFNGEFGLFNALLEPLGVKVPWLTSPGWAMASIVLMTLWWTLGTPTVILVAGLKQIPRSYLEAAAVDGAGAVRRFFWVTLPLLRPVLLFVAVIQVIGGFQVFGQTFIITRGGPEQATRVLMQYIYETSFNMYRLGYGAAMSWLLFVIIVVVSLAQVRLLRQR
ncbi:MAG TPA: sugar ABC transporter permease [Phycisphaeraceae bacterium]